ncbi:MAG: peptidylprolyl isomerase [Candidatus Micrarchaeota archaeon]|nr:peptidylprolyl isomerase [Candidatus Micrarchaeota archaeon]
MLPVWLAAAFLFLLGCASQQSEVDGMKYGGQPIAASKGDIVQVDYIGRLESGEVFDTNIASEARKAGLPLREKYELLEFEVGAGQMIPGFDSAVVGMKEGEEKTVKIPADQAYGEWRKEAVILVPLEKIGNSGGIRVGSWLYASNGAAGKVVAIENGSAKVDFNHELAGKDLIFTIRMAKIKRK